MSKFAVKGAATGTGTFTLESPATNTDRTFTLPDTDGSFITADGSGNVTISGGLTLTSGTANGVTYLNGSKVLTSGSALTFDGTNLGVGTATPAGKLDVAGTLFVSSADGNSGGILSTSGEAGAGNKLIINANRGSGETIFQVNSAEQMRLTSTGLGIGTSSPGFKLDVQSASTGTVASFRGSSAGRFLYITSSTTTNDGDTYTLDSTSSSGVLAFATTSTERMRIDSSGNLGLGVTPSAWDTGSSVRALQLNGGSLWSYAGFGLGLINNAFYNSAGNYIYRNNGFALDYFQSSNNGTHIWRTAPSGTAGNAITFTQAMTLDASGNLGIGTSSPAQKLDVYGNGMKVNNASYTGYIGADSVFGSSGVASSFTIRSDNALTFSTGGPYTRATIDSSGNLLVGTTSAIQVGKYSCSFAGNVSNGIVLQTTYASTGTDFVRCVNSAGTAIGNITQNGASTVAYNTSSDYRLKNTIATMTGALAKVALLKPCTYKWNADGSDGEGFIAHELAEVVPDCVTGEKDAVDADGNPVYQGIDTSFLVATLTAAIQEQQAIIESLKSRLDAANL